MSKTQRDESSTSEEHPSSTEKRSVEDRPVTDEERDELIEDAKRFKKKHERTFRLLSEGQE